MIVLSVLTGFTVGSLCINVSPKFLWPQATVVVAGMICLLVLALS